MTSTPTLNREVKEGPLEVLGYEVRMLRHAERRVEEHWAKRDADANGWLECYLTHYRALIDFLGTTRETPRTFHGSTDLTLTPTETWAEMAIDMSGPEAQKLIVDGKGLRDRWFLDISQFLSHVTARRYKDGAFTWDWRAMTVALDPVLAAFRALAAANGLTWRDRFLYELAAEPGASSATVETLGPASTAPSVTFTTKITSSSQ